MGYAGGAATNPSYHNLGDHSEAVQIVFDPSRISYGTLLDIFWKSHDPTRDSWSRQYRAAVFYHDEKQKGLAVATRYKLASTLKERIVTSIEPYKGFHIAEDYHQKHSLSLYPEVMKELREIYPDFRSLVDSTAAARVNGYLGGHGSCDSVKSELDGFGLSQRTKEIVASVVCRRSVSVTYPVRQISAHIQAVE